jgi:hypothetical protein
MNRYFINLIISLIASALGGTVAGRRAVTPMTKSSSVPQQTTYTITIQGITASGNTAFPQRRASYVPEQRFRIAGKLIVVPGQDRTGVTSSNPRDIGIFCGNPHVGQQGALWFATNTRVFALVGLGNHTQRDATLNAARVSVNEASGTVTVSVAPRSRAMASQLNFFNKSSGITALPYQVIAGKLTLRFSAHGARVSGQLNFIGGGYTAPANAAISASISGVRQ